VAMPSAAPEGAGARMVRRRRSPCGPLGAVEEAAGAVALPQFFWKNGPPRPVSSFVHVALGWATSNTNWSAGVLKTRLQREWSARPRPRFRAHVGRRSWR